MPESGKMAAVMASFLGLGLSAVGSELAERKDPLRRQRAKRAGKHCRQLRKMFRYNGLRPNTIREHNGPKAARTGGRQAQCHQRDNIAESN
jgi:hypothetical protein